MASSTFPFKSKRLTAEFVRLGAVNLFCFYRSSREKFSSQQDNEGRVRGVSQDSNNKTTDIVEWEEVEIETQQEYYELERVELTPEQQELVETIGHAIADLVIYGTGQLTEHVIKPWWKNSAKLWIKWKAADIKQFFSSKTKAERIFAVAQHRHLDGVLHPGNGLRETS